MTPLTHQGSVEDLLARVEAATGADRELDEAIIEATNPHKSGPYAWHRAAASAFAWDTRVTASLDAALALANRLYPNAYHWIVRQALDEWQHRGGDASAFARCVIAALLRTLSGERQG